MLSEIKTATLHGIDAVPVIVETDIARGMPATDIVGHVDSIVQESRHRIRAAIRNTGFDYPQGRIVINMAPADIIKRGSILDLAMAMGILAASRQVMDDELSGYCFFGEISLDGAIHRVNGLLPVLLKMKELGVRKAVVPYGNRAEAALIRGMQVYAAQDLPQVCGHFNLQKPLKRIEQTEISDQTGEGGELDFVDVRGQEAAKRALMIAAAGGHGILMTGSPSTGKTMLAERIPTILPRMSYDEIMEVTQIYSVAGLLDETLPYVSRRPFRRPHHRVTSSGLIGGGNNPKPGEVTMSDKGVLFLDEFSEFNRGVIDNLRQPMETGRIVISRAGEAYIYPADFLLVAATNPCRCGYWGDSTHQCSCSAREIERYQSRISGPIMDRIDIHVVLSAVKYQDIESGRSASSEEMRIAVEGARKIQADRFRRCKIQLNSQMTNRQCERYLNIGEEERAFIEQAYDAYDLNPRTLIKFKRVARTIADLSGSERVTCEHLREAACYRRTDVVR